MAETAHVGTLYGAIEHLPEGVVGEIIGGQLHTHPRPAGAHIGVAAGLFAEIAGPFYRGRGGPGGWWILAGPELHFRRDAEVLVPDIAGWHRERLPALPADQRFEVVPDWVCEVLSPSTASTDREIKMPIYARDGVAHAWLVDPKQQRLEAYARAGAEWRRIGTFTAAEPIRVTPFDAVAIASPWV